MYFEPDQFYHIYNRGNNQSKIYFEDENYIFFLSKIRAYLLDYVKVLAYCLMPNHFHILIYTYPDMNCKPSTLNQKIGTLLSSYTQAINRKHNRIGSLFQASTKSKCVLSSDENYFLTCLNYIHQNPLKAGIVDDLKKWQYSSYLDYAGLRKGSLPDILTTFKLLNIKDQSDFINLSNRLIDSSLIKSIF